jgi:hypothetical protein
MRVGPTHRDLEDLVEFVEGRVILDLDASPNRRLAAFECNLELVDHGSRGVFFCRHDDSHMHDLWRFGFNRSAQVEVWTPQLLSSAVPNPLS